MSMPILIADDDPASLRLLEQLLRRWDYAPLTAADGEAAWEILLQHKPQVAILDWQMPGLDGPTLCRRVRDQADLASSYLLLLTARNRPEDLVAGLRAGADDYLVKPFDPPELRARLGVGERVVVLQNRLADRVRELEDALAHVRQLQGLIPICAYCKKIRNEEEHWERIERYLSARSDARFTHGICPECRDKVESRALR